MSNGDVEERAESSGGKNSFYAPTHTHRTVQVVAVCIAASVLFWSLPRCLEAVRDMVAASEAPPWLQITLAILAPGGAVAVGAPAYLSYLAKRSSRANKRIDDRIRKRDPRGEG